MKQFHEQLGRTLARGIAATKEKPPRHRAVCVLKLWTVRSINLPGMRLCVSRVDGADAGATRAQHALCAALMRRALVSTLRNRDRHHDQTSGDH